MKVYGKALRRYDRSSWRTFCSGIEGIVPAARLHKALSKDENYQIGNLKLLSGSYTSSESEVVSHLLETRFPDCELVSEENMTSLENTATIPTEIDWLEASKIVDVNKIKWAINGVYA
jgi:hypothetical protein